MHNIFNGSQIAFAMEDAERGPWWWITLPCASVIHFNVCPLNVKNTISHQQLHSNTAFSSRKRPGRLSNEAVVGGGVDGAVEPDHLAHLGHEVLDLRDDGTGDGDELGVVDRDAGVERRDQELANALGTVAGAWLGWGKMDKMEIYKLT